MCLRKSWICIFRNQKKDNNCLSKQEFWDIVKIRYGWSLLSRLPNTCNCGTKYDLQHSLSCKKSGFVSLRHNHLRNLTATLTDQICHDVRIEPHLQTLTGETFDSRSTRDEARLDISARGFRTKYQIAFLDVRVFDSNVERYEAKTLQQCYWTNEMEKKRKYNESILQVENGSFIPLAFSINGGMVKEANKCYSRIAKKFVVKRDEPYSVMMSWIRRKITFSMMKSIIMCICGSWSIKHEREKHNVEELASYSEARCNITWLTH